MVIAFHCRVVLPDGYFLLWPLDICWSGVDLFFVLSGFLITGILLETRDSPSYFGTFYARRALRIFPLYFAYVLVAVALVRPAGAWWYFTYLTNWKPGHGAADPYLNHLWSLAVEEQFYIVWPAVVYWTTPRKLAWGCGLIAVIALACRCLTGMAGEAAYRLTPCRIDALAFGAFVAVGVREFPVALARWTRPILLTALAGFLLIISLPRAGFWNDPPMRTVGASLIGIVYGSLICTVILRPRGFPARLASGKALRTCGAYSYAMYVLQPVLLKLLLPVAGIAPGGNPALKCILYFGTTVILTLAAAWMSGRWLEQPFLRLKARFAYVQGPTGTLRAPA
jgi:peptidoglycan/LPS O-acetylase OafA/YrhL